MRGARWGLVRTATVMLALALAEPLSAATVFVSPGGDDSADGTTWATAKATVQAGLDAAVAGDQVWVAAGTYVERITLKADVELYGGFVGNEAGLNQRDWSANETILDGSRGGSVVVAPTGATPSTRIDGFTIRNGVSGRSSPGAAVRCTLASPTIANNRLTDNRSGEVILCSNSSPVIQHNTITANSSTSASITAIYCSASSPTISDNTISENGGRGGFAIYCTASSSPTITRNTLTGNTVSYLIFIANSSATIASNVLRDNNWAMAVAHSGSPSSIIVNNSISSSGGITGSGSSLIANNTITGSVDYGISCSGAPTIVNNIVAFNSRGIKAEGTATLRNNCVYNPGGTNYDGVTPGPGDISVDPMLTMPGFSEVHLLSGSPCIDRGDDSIVQPDWLDVDGLARTGNDHVDIGADEFDGTTYTVTPRVIRVSTSGDDANDGSTWALAKRTAQAGIDAAAAAVNAEVWVAAGTYNSITLQNGVRVYGGFAGNEATRDQRDIAANVTTLDGRASATVVSATSLLYGRNAIDGFTIRRGNPNGIRCLLASVVISNNTITECASGDGAIYCQAGLSTITGNVITANSTNGIYAKTVSSSLISENSIASNTGAGICCIGSSPTITNNTLSGNSGYAGSQGRAGGGIYVADPCTPTIVNNTIESNRAGMGGGIYCYCLSEATIEGNLIRANSGSGIWCAAVRATIRCNRITANNDGGIYCPTASSPTIFGNIIDANVGDYAGGIGCEYCSPPIINNTIVANRVYSGRTGGGIWCHNATPEIVNNVIAFNTSGVYADGSRSPAIKYNCVHNPGGSDYLGTDPGEGDISFDPLFLNREAGDYHLLPASPCRDAGYNFVDPPVGPDMDGQLRTQGVSVDIGADEVWAGDFNYDGNVNQVDCDLFVTCASGPAVFYETGCGDKDLDGDSDVDMEDFGLFQVLYR